MRRRSLFPPGEFPAAVAARPSLWRLVHLRRLDLTLAIYGRFALAVKQRLWPKARQALTEAPRKRAYRLEKFQQSVAQLMNRLLIAQPAHQGASNDLF
jgi:hypothetical protein